MVLVGLTGGIASGKSVVAARLAELGAYVVDADQLAREVVAPGTDGLAEVVAAFGPEVLGPDGGLDRAAMARLAFADQDVRKRLEAIIHPRVRARAAELTLAAPPGAVVVQDIPLLAESGLAPMFDVVVVVTAPEEVRVARASARDAARDAARGADPGQVRARIAAQAGDAVRLAVADVVLDNSGDLADLHRQVDALWARLTTTDTSSADSPN